MIYVVVDEAIPESRPHGDGDHATIGTMTGFATMMLPGVAPA